jgi:hypothetical protein
MSQSTGGRRKLSAANVPGLKASDLMPNKSAPAQIPGVTKFVQNNQPQSLSEKMAYGAGSMVPFALSQLVPGADEVGDATALGRLYSAAKGATGLTASGATSAAGE